MGPPVRLWSQHLANLARAAFWLLLALVLLLQLTGSRGIERQRAAALGQFERERSSRVIAMIHRQEGASLLGVPVVGSISIDDSEAVLRAIRLTPPAQPTDVILHTPGGLVLAAEQIAKALVQRKGKVTVFVPHYAMSGATLIALAADEIVMSSHAVLGPVDPQLGQYPAASLLKVVAKKPIAEVDDQTLVLADVAEKAVNQVSESVKELLARSQPPGKAEELARLLSTGTWTHDYPITVEEAQRLGLKVRSDMPPDVLQLMSLFPQPSRRQPSVEFLPVPRRVERAKPPNAHES